MNKIQEEHYYLTDLIGTKVMWNGKKIGALSDLTIHAEEKTGQIEHISVSRKFGNPALFIPWECVFFFSHQEIRVTIPNLKSYEIDPTDHDVLLKDQVIDKRIIDTKDQEVEVVYDIRLVCRENKLFITDVDLGKSRMFKRLGMRTIGKILHAIAGKMQEKSISWNFIQPLPTGMTSFNGDLRLNILKENLSVIHPIDLAHMLEEMTHDQRSAVFKQLTLAQASQTLEAIDPSLQRSIVESLTKEKTLELFDLMTPGQIADVLSSLPRNISHPLVHLLDDDTKNKVKAMLEKQEQHVENLATEKIIKCQKTDIVGKIQTSYAKLAKHKDVTMYLYIVDEEDELVGIIDIKELLEGKETATLGEIMIRNIATLQPRDTYKKAAEIFAKYDFRAIPIVNARRKILGAVTYKDLMKFKRKFID